MAYQAFNDVTPLVKKLAALRKAGEFDRASALLPIEEIYRWPSP